MESFGLFRCARVARFCTLSEDRRDKTQVIHVIHIEWERQDSAFLRVCSTLSRVTLISVTDWNSNAPRNYCDDEDSAVCMIKNAEKERITSALVSTVFSLLFYLLRARLSHAFREIPYWDGPPRFDRGKELRQ